MFLDFNCSETTNYNENLHSIKAWFLNIVYNYGKSSIARICASILQYNEGYSWTLVTLKKLHANIIINPRPCGIDLFLSKKKKEDGIEKRKISCR